MKYKQQKSARRYKILVAILLFACLTACSEPNQMPVRREFPIKPDHLDELLALQLRETLDSFWEEGISRDFGFENKNELDAATLGRVLPTYLLTPQAVRAYQKGQPISSLLPERSWWIAPVLVNQEVKSLMLVDKMGNFISFAGNAKEMNFILPEQYDDPAITVRHFRQLPIQAEFLLLEQEGDEKLFLLRPTGFYDALDPMAHQLTAPLIMMPAIKQAVNQKCTIFFFYREC